MVTQLEARKRYSMSIKIGVMVVGQGMIETRELYSLCFASFLTPVGSTAHLVESLH